MKKKRPDGTKDLLVTMPEDLKEWLKERATIDHRSMNNFIVDLLEKLRDEEESNY